jgi:shikimate dehydrogenase
VSVNPLNTSSTSSASSGVAPTQPISATTLVCAVIGEPVRHSLSPIIHNAGFAALGLNYVYVAFPVSAGRANDALIAMRTYGIHGLSVTMPHKADVFAAVDRRTDRARMLQSCNTVFWEGDQLVGDSTDGEGCVRALTEEGVNIADVSCVVLGAGGASRAVVAALAHAGAGSVTVISRRADRARAAAELAGSGGRVPDTKNDIAAAIGAAGIIINATPLGMGKDDPLPLDPDLLNEHHVMNDLIYHPLETPLLRAARERGCHVITNGTGMLLHQAALQFEQWTEQRAPIAVMRSALVDEISRRTADVTSVDQ